MTIPILPYKPQENSRGLGVGGNGYVHQCDRFLGIYVTKYIQLYTSDMYRLVNVNHIPITLKKKKSCLSIVRPSLSSTKSDSQEAPPLHFSGLSDYSHYLANTSLLVRAVHALSPQSW